MPVQSCYCNGSFSTRPAFNECSSWSMVLSMCRWDWPRWTWWEPRTWENGTEDNATGRHIMLAHPYTQLMAHRSQASRHSKAETDAGNTIPVDAHFPGNHFPQERINSTCACYNVTVTRPWVFLYYLAAVFPLLVRGKNSPNWWKVLADDECREECLQTCISVGSWTTELAAHQEY